MTNSGYLVYEYPVMADDDISNCIIELRIPAEWDEVGAFVGDKFLTWDELAKLEEKTRRLVYSSWKDR